MQSNSNTTIIVNTCDDYSDVLKLFFSAFNEYWPSNSYQVVINSEKNVYNEYDAITYNCVTNSCKWGERFINTLKSIDTEFVLVVYDDFILEDFVKANDIVLAQQLLQSNNNGSVVYLMNTELPIIESNDQDQFLRVLNRCDFRLNSFPGLWRREHLISYIGIVDNPWAWELFGSYRTFNKDNIFYTLNPKFSDIFPYNHEKGGAIYRGKWVREVVEKKISKYGLNINPLARGFSENSFNESRSLTWKFNFFLIGFRMIGFQVFDVVISLIKSKYFAKKTD
jgi:hypothetical protein